MSAGIRGRGSSGGTAKNRDRVNDGPTAVVVDAQAPGLAVVRSLGRRGVRTLVATHSPHEAAVASRYAAGVILTPEPGIDDEGFVTALLRGLPAGERPVVIPTSDDAVVALAGNIDRLAERCTVAGSSLPVADWFIDKRKTARLAAKVDVRAPQTSLPLDLEQASALGESLVFPALVKPSEGHVFIRETGLKMLAVHNTAALLDAVRACMEAGVQPIVQEIIPGPPEYGVNHIVYLRGDEVVAEFTARKIRNWPADWGSPCAVVSERVDGLTDRTRRLLVAAGYEGMACAEYKYDDRYDDYQLFEVNVRHNLSGSLAPRCGVDFPWIDYANRAGIDVGRTPALGAFEEGIHWVDTLRDVGSVVTTGTWWRHPQKAVAPYGGAGTRAFWDRDDMEPFRLHVADSAGRVLRRLRGRFGVSRRT